MMLWRVWLNTEPFFNGECEGCGDTTVVHTVHLARQGMFDVLLCQGCTKVSLAWQAMDRLTQMAAVKGFRQHEGIVKMQGVEGVDVGEIATKLHRHNKGLDRIIKDVLGDTDEPGLTGPIADFIKTLT